MKVEAYMCDHCGKIFEAESMVGIIPVEDMFIKIDSYPTVMTEAKVRAAAIHYSVECYRDAVTVKAGNIIDRRKDERGYELKVKELAYGLRAQCVANHRDRARHKKI